jgi:TP901-1 family phage major tail protein
MRGVDILIQVEDPAAVAGTYITVGGQRGATLSESNETLDVTTKDSGGAYEYDYGLYGWTISCDGLYVPDDVGYTALKTAFRDKTKVKVRIQEEGTATEEGEALVISKELDGPYDAEVTYTLELQGTGKLTPVV